MSGGGPERSSPMEEMSQRTPFEAKRRSVLHSLSSDPLLKTPFHSTERIEAVRSPPFTTQQPTPQRNTHNQFFSPVTRRATETTSVKGPSRELDSRVIASKVIEEQVLGIRPTDFETREEIEVVEERTVTIPVRQVVERPPRAGSEVIREEIVYKPEIHYVDKIIEVPNIEQTVTHVPVKKIIEVPKDVVKVVRVPEIRSVLKEVEVPGKIIEITRKVPQEVRKIVPKIVDHQVPLVVAQTLHSNIAETGTERLPVKVRQLNPVIVPLDIYIPKPVRRPLIARQRRDYTEKVEIPAAQYNAILNSLNPHLQNGDDDEKKALSLLYSQSNVVLDHTGEGHVVR